MKKILLVATVAAMMAACSQKQSVVQTELPVTSINVELLKDSLDLNMDINGLQLADLRVLRNAPAARQGFPFKDAYLRAVYGSTTWYDSLTWVFDESMDFDKVPERENENWRDHYYRVADETGALKYTADEQDFITRVKAREDELLNHNFDAGEGLRVNLPNLVNPTQLTDMERPLAQQLAQNGFVIVPADHEQLFHVYEQNDYRQFPSFVTTDLYLQLYHLYFDCLLREMEEHKLDSLLNRFCSEALQAFAVGKYDQRSGLDTLAAATWLNTYWTVANALIQGKEPAGNADARQEYQRVMKSENDFSAFLGYEDVMFAYSLFRPRGHYTRSEKLQRYFRTMMWLQTVPFQTNRPADMFKASLLAAKICTDKGLNTLYRQITQPMGWLMGKPDDVSILQVGDLLAKMATDDIDPNELGKKVDEIAEKQTRIRPKFQRTSRNKVCLMPQRYQPDAEVLQEMVDYDSKPTERATPQGLDVMAAMGVSAAEQLLIEEGQKWKGFRPTLEKMKQRMKEIDWQETIATQWMATVRTVNDKDGNAPYFMVTPEWARKDLNAALGSWAELKHDAILYAKQPFGAECGGGGIPDPVVKGFVEPNTAFWKKAGELLESTHKRLTEQHLMTEKVEQATERMLEEVNFLLRVSEKELQGQTLTDEEYDQLKCIGATFENISIELVREPDQCLMGWNDVQGTDRKVALVADVYTANADNNPDKCILYEAIGLADEIYVVVEIDGYLYLTRGAVFSYREFTLPTDRQRMTDEEWQQEIERNPRMGVPAWMEPVTVPLKQKPQVNEEYFYSSGC